MTNSNLKLDPFIRHFIGFDRLHHQLKQSAAQNYPPFNIEHIEGEESNEILITLAVAGFAKEELNVEQHDQKLTVSGKKAQAEGDETRNFVHRGISTRAFHQSFRLHEFLEITDVTLDAGLLTISLKEVVPEERKPKTLTIN